MIDLPKCPVCNRPLVYTVMDNQDKYRLVTFRCGATSRESHSKVTGMVVWNWTVGCPKAMPDEEPT